MERAKLLKVLSSFLIGSVLSLSIGGIFLYAYSLVPLSLISLTAVAVVILLPVAYFVFRGNVVAINIATILGFVAPVISLSTPAHIGVLESFGQDPLISILGLLQALGFIVFPFSFIAVRFAYQKRLAAPKKMSVDGN